VTQQQQAPQYGAAQTQGVQQLTALQYQNLSPQQQQQYQQQILQIQRMQQLQQQPGQQQQQQPTAQAPAQQAASTWQEYRTAEGTVRCAASDRPPLLRRSVPCAIMPMAVPWQAYYYNTATGETTWTNPVQPHRTLRVSVRLAYALT
jgi:hypothetical protein